MGPENSGEIIGNLGDVFQCPPNFVGTFTCREHTEACIYMQKVAVSAVCELRIHLKNTKQLESVQRTFYSLGRFLLGHLHMCHVWKVGRNVDLLVIGLCSCAKEHVQDHGM